MPDVTQILQAIDAGDRQAATELLPLVYDELRKLAAAKLALERPGHTLNATALVHEAYLRLVGDQSFDGRGHFFAAAAAAMRRILVESARRKKADKRGGNWSRVSLNQAAPVSDSPPEQLLALDEALTRLDEQDPLAGKLVKLSYFAGLSVEQAAASLGVSTATAYRHWTFGRAWLHGQLLDESAEPCTG